ncbi:MAG: divalent metal cation transporter, partial [Bacteroidales bacterium]|nr:divalent metal cation transporter [Bacteroidales bacterium]
WMLITILGSLSLLVLFGKTMGFMVDLATTISFVVAPILAILNYLAVTAKDFKDKPKKWLIIYAWIGMIFMSLFSVFYLIWKFL